MDEKSFEALFVIEPSHDLSIMKKYTDTIRFISTGNERVEDLPEKIKESLKKFNPETDAIIPMGRVSACLITGIILHSLFPFDLIKIGIYNRDDYIFLDIEP